MSRLITGTGILHRALPPTVDADLFTDAKLGGGTDLRLACNRPEKSRHLRAIAVVTMTLGLPVAANRQ